MPQSLKGAVRRSNTQLPENAGASLVGQDVERLKEDLIAMVYHDIRSPLSNIVSSLEVLSSLPSCAQDATAQSMVEIAQRSTERIQRLIDTLLDLNGLEASQSIGRRNPVAMRTLVHEAVDIILPLANIKGLKLGARLAADLPPAFADEDMIRRVLINLLENSIKFTAQGGKIQVTVQAQGDMILTSIKDNGPGIAPGDQERIFEKYTRLNALDDGSGLGLGLTFCRLAVNSHGGHIWVESKPGAGAAFKFTLPVARQV